MAAGPLLTISVNLDFEAVKLAMDQAPEVLDRHFSRADVLAVGTLEAAVKENINTPYGTKPAAVAFGHLVTNVYGEPFEAGTHGGFVSVGGVASAYALPVETGTRPHFPPVEALIPWVIKKGMASDEKSAREIAWLIARKIAKRGTQGHFMFERAIAECGPAIIALYEQELVAAMEEIGASMGGGQ